MTDAGWRPLRTTRQCGCGMARRARRCRRSKAIQDWSGQWRSHVTGAGWRPLRTTRQCGCGMARRARRCRRSKAIQIRSTQWRSHVTARRLASASDDQTVRVWDGETGAPLQTLEGHTDWVSSVAFSRDGRRLASASSDQTVRVWDGETGALLQKLKINTTLRELSFNPQDSYLVTDIGSIILDLSSSHSTQEPNWSRYSIRSDRFWITWNGRNVLWVPPEYRSLTSTVRETSIAIGCKTGRVILIKFSSIIYPVS